MTSPSTHVTLTTGEANVLAQLPQVAELAARSGQSGECNDIPFTLQRPTLTPATPHLLQLFAGEQLTGAALLFTDPEAPLDEAPSFFSTNTLGRRTLFAEQSNRVAVAAMSCQALLERGAHHIALNFEMGPLESRNLEPPGTLVTEDATLTKILTGIEGATSEWAINRGRGHFEIPLLSTVEATMALLGRRTRRNLRYYARLCIKDLGCIFEPYARLDRVAFLELSRSATFPVPDWVALWRFESRSRYSQVFHAGLHDRNGQWLSVIGGRRNAGITEVDWQLNRAGYERYSLSAALRSLLFEYEVLAGSVSFSFEGGSKHTMHRAARELSLYNLAVRRTQTSADDIPDFARQQRWAEIERSHGLSRGPRDWIACHDPR